MLGEKFQEALAFAVAAHDGQERKTTGVPYVSHPLQVAGIALEHGASEKVAIAALLHDVIEDTSYTHADLAERFGSTVADIVLGCSDADGPEVKGAWRPRKQEYLEHLQACDDATVLVSCADKLHNVRTILTDLRAIGPSVWERFSGRCEGSLWYYTELARIFESRDLPPSLVQELRRTVDALVRESGCDPAP